ncbi:hypothetical protein V7150_16220 [Neobacillus drentensis]|uniref:hypothetical protein n=1 Tax=Neobacillus drentensis TaxID=220684 RepID=UPI002FFE160D
MAHVRSNCKNDSTTYSASPIIFKKIKKHRHRLEFDSQSEAITDLITKGLKFEALMRKREERMLG